ncbi:metalloregulator ArsR/SmtB family transcription factor [soil metagenome]
MANQIPAVTDAVFRALADPTRRAILERLGRSDASVSDLAAPFAMALPSFLKHVRLLEETGLIRSRKAGRTRTCTLQPAPLALIEDWLAQQRSQWERHTDRLEQFVLGQQQQGSPE